MPCVQCYRVIYVYMGFAVFDIFFLITGIVMVEVLQVRGTNTCLCAASLLSACSLVCHQDAGQCVMSVS